MGDAIFGLVGAILSLVGVVVGAAISWLRDLWREKKSQRREARYLAIRVVCVLDDFLEECTDVVTDDGLCCGQRNEEGYLEAQTSHPTGIYLPEDVDWKSIDHSLMYRILALPSLIAAANRAVAFSLSVAYPPDFDEYFEERQSRFASLGIEVADIAERLRRLYSIPDRERGEWDPVKTLKDKKREIEDRQASQAEHMPDFLTDITSDDAPESEKETGTETAMNR
jgi:hypothetical protein